MEIAYEYAVEVAEWSSNVFIENTTVEYAYNTDISSGTSNLTSFGWGEKGVQFDENVTVGATKRVRFKNKIQPTDKIEFQHTVPGSILADDFFTLLGTTAFPKPYIGQSGTAYGLTIEQVNDYEVDVVMTGWAAPGFSYGGAGTAWSIVGPSNYNLKWRVMKSSNPLTLGHDLVGQNKSGLVAGAGQLKGTNTDDDAATGNVGEYVSSSYTNATALGVNNIWIDGTSITLSPGDWEITHQASWEKNTATLVGIYWRAGISINSGNSFTDEIRGTNSQYYRDGGTGLFFDSLNVTTRVSIASSTTYYAKLWFNDVSSGEPYVNGILRARRVR
jgi:hypothetical protein